MIWKETACIKQAETVDLLEKHWFILTKHNTCNKCKLARHPWVSKSNVGRVPGGSIVWCWGLLSTHHYLTSWESECVVLCCLKAPMWQKILTLTSSERQDMSPGWLTSTALLSTTVYKPHITDLHWSWMLALTINLKSQTVSLRNKLLLLQYTHQQTKGPTHSRLEGHGGWSGSINCSFAL